MMVAHSSLSASIIKVDPIEPVEKMDPYKPCWCRSGKKYKWCHYQREKQKPVNIFEIENQMLKEMRKGYCLHPDPVNDPCSPIISKAHTVQKKGGLAAISEAGHVLTVKPNMKGMIETDGMPEPRKIGINNASVFPGFCSKHDTILFKPIEGNSLHLNKDSAFLFSYRAIAYERFAKDSQLRGMAAQREADKGHLFWKQAGVQTHIDAMITGIKLGLQDVERWKNAFDDLLLSGDRTDYHFLAVRFDKVLPLVGCGAFHPEFDFAGKALQKLGRDVQDFDQITLTVTTFNGETIVALGWIGDNTPAKQLAESYKVIEDSRKADALVRLMYIHTDNLFLTPSWWDALDSSDKLYLTKLMMSGTTMRERSGVELRSDQKSFFTAAIKEIAEG